MTESTIGRPIAAHHFRHSLVTASSESDSAALAAVQGNSVATQNRVYRVRQVREDQQRFAAEMMEGGRAVVV